MIQKLYFGIVGQSRDRLLGRHTRLTVSSDSYLWTPFEEGIIHRLGFAESFNRNWLGFFYALAISEKVEALSRE